MSRIFPDYYRGPVDKKPTNPFDRINKMDKQQSSYLGNNTYLLSVNTPAPVTFEMGNGVYGNYDGLRLIANPYNGWKAEPANTPLIKSDYLFVPQGSQLPLANEMIYSQIPKDSMFVFAKNQASPNCRSEYSTSTGQVCTTTKQQTNIGQNRGNNKNYPDDCF
jgi:hypothetical protein